eukprot:332680-Rhodomonas_salina.1
MRCAVLYSIAVCGAQCSTVLTHGFGHVTQLCTLLESRLKEVLSEDQMQELQTLDPKPLTLNPKPETRNPNPQVSPSSKTATHTSNQPIYFDAQPSTSGTLFGSASSYFPRHLNSTPSLQVPLFGAQPIRTRSGLCSADTHTPQRPPGPGPAHREGG